MTGDKNADIIQAAIRVFGRRSYSAASVRDVADALDMPKATLYHYIKSKEDLLSKIFATSHAELEVVMAEVVAQDVPEIERLRSFIERYVQWSIANLDKSIIYSREWRYLSGDLRKVVIEGRVRLDNFLISLIDAAKAGGVVDAALDTKRAAFFLWGAISAVPDWYRHDGRETPEAIAASYGTLAVNVVTGKATGLALNQPFGD